MNTRLIIAEVPADERKATFDKAVERTGIDGQIDKACTEMAEFIHAALDTRAAGVTYSWAFFEELGHVQLCIELILSRLEQCPSESYGTLLNQTKYIREKRMRDWAEFEMVEHAKRKMREKQ
jgi:hypothetical protein